MATERVLKALFGVASMPAVLVAQCAVRYRAWGIHADLRRCEEIVDKYAQSVPRPFIDALVVAEDHRSALHSGIDPIGILRALILRIASGRIQGASTIEQQLVRVVTGRYEKTILRKLREQALALLLSRTRTKDAIASAYLSVAFYGTACIGLKGLQQMCGHELKDADSDKVFQAVAQLKYPRPRKVTLRWRVAIERRITHLRARKEGIANNAFKPTPKSAAASSISIWGAV